MKLSEFFENEYEFPLTVRVIKDSEIDHEFVIETNDNDQYLDIQDDIGAGYGDCELVGTSYKDGILTYEVRDSGFIVYESIQKLKELLASNLWKGGLVLGCPRFDCTYVNLIKGAIRNQIQRLEDPKRDIKEKIQECKDIQK